MVNAQSGEAVRARAGLQLSAAAPRILGVLLSRTRGEQDDFRLLAAQPLIVATVRFDQAVAVDTARGSPEIILEIGTPPLRQGGYAASYAGGSGSAELQFHYSPWDRHQDVRDVGINADAIRLRGSVIRAFGRFTAASLAHAPAAEAGANADARSMPAIVRTPLPAVGQESVSGPPESPVAASLRRQWADLQASGEALIARHRLTHRRRLETATEAPAVTHRADIGPAPSAADPLGFPVGYVAGSVGPASTRRAAAESATPGAPRLWVFVSGQTRLSLQWTRGSDSDIEYLLETSSDGVSNWTNALGEGRYVAVAPAPNNTHFQHTGLQPATTYYYRVTARNGHGFGTLSEAKSATTNAMVVVPECAGALWSAKITVGTFGSNDDLGYRGEGGSQAISDDTFTIGAATYTVNQIWFRKSRMLLGRGGRQLSHAGYFFTLDRTFRQVDRDDLILYIGNVRLPLSSSAYTAQPAGERYQWLGTDRIGDLYKGTFNYVSGDYVPVCLLSSGPRPALTLQLDPASISENGGVSTVTATASVASPDPFTVTVTAAANAPASAADFTVGENRVLTFAANATESTGTVTITAVNNSIDTAARTVRVSGTVPDGSRATAPEDVTLTITGDDAAPTLSVAVDQQTVAEDGGVARVTISTGGTAYATAQQVVLGLAGSAELDGDYGISARTLTLQAGALSTTATITAQDDAIDEDDESIEITATHGGIAVGTVQTVTITDDDTASISLVLNPETIAEDAGGVTVTVRADMAFASEQTIGLAFAGNAQRNTDYSVPADALTLPAADTEVSTTVTVTDDSLIEGDETIQITARHGSDEVQRSVTITDDDTASIELTVSPASIAEADGVAVLTVSTADGSTFAEEQSISLSFAGTATRTDDYTVGTDALVLAANSSSVTTSVTAVSDVLDEADETIEITATHGASSVQRTIKILDDDARSVSAQPMFLTVDPARAPEDAGVMQFEARVTVPAGQTELTLNYRAYAALGDSAAPGRDFTAVADGTLNLSPARNADQVAGRFSVPILDDELDEDDETFSVRVWVVGVPELAGYETTARGTIEDDDAEPAVSVTDARGVEDSGEILFPVRLTRVSGRAVTVRYKTEDGTAMAGTDYYGVAAGALTLAAGRTGGTIRVRLRDDDAKEGDETFAVRLIDPATNATLSGDAVATGTIVDDDGTVAQLWLARFARTTATHVLDAVGDRVSGPPAPQPEVVLSGFPVQPGTAASQRDLSDAPVRTLAPHELLAGSSFLLSAGAAGAPAVPGAGDSHWTFWGRGSVTRLAGKDAPGTGNETAVNGTIASGTLGVDYDWGPVVAGLAVATTAGGADIAAATEAALEASAWMVSAHPYARVTIAELVDIWGLLGFGLGGMGLSEDRPVEAGTAMLMGALGARGTLVAPDTLAGFGLAVKTDGFVTRIYGAETAALPETYADAVLVRMTAEGSYRAQLADGSVLTPVVEAGVRLDRGHAETGFGGELGGGVRYVQPAWGLTVNAGGRFLLAHQDRGFQGWGLGGSMLLRPDVSGRGLNAAMHTSVGMMAGGASALWADGVGPRVTAFDAGAAAGVLDAEVGYGVSILDDAAVLTPYAGMTMVDRGANTYRIGGRFDLGTSFSLSLEGERSDSTAGAHEHGVALRGALHW